MTRRRYRREHVNRAATMARGHARTIAPNCNTDGQLSALLLPCVATIAGRLFSQ